MEVPGSLVSPDQKEIRKQRALKRTRNFLIVVLVLLYLQFELGIDTNLANPPSLPPIQFSIPQIFSYLSMVGGEAVLHAVNGMLIFIVSLFLVYFSLRSGVREVKALGSAALFAIGFGLLNGLGFVLSGFQNSGPSYGMSHAFIASFTIYAAELYFVAKWMYRPPSNAGNVLKG